MTTISWDGRYVASDSQTTFHGDQRCQHPGCKLIVEGDTVFASSGSRALFLPMIEWWKAGCKPDEVPKDGAGQSSTLLVFKDGRCHSYVSTMPYAEEFVAPDAWGSGQAYACVAMSMGADARRAVEEAIKFDTNSGGDIQVIDLLALKIQEIAA